MFKVSHIEQPFFIICGSESKRRYEAIQSLDNVQEIRTCKPQIDEYNTGCELRKNVETERLVETLGKAKADAVINVIKNKQPEMLCDAKNWIIVTGDTIVVYNNTILEKPTNEKELLAFFDLYNQKDSRNQFSPIHIHTSLVLTCLKTKRQASIVNSAKVILTKHIPIENISLLLPEALHSAGGLILEHPAIRSNVKILQGTLETIQGLDAKILSNLLNQFVEKNNLC